jgi:hypothetical protein
LNLSKSIADDARTFFCHPDKKQLTVKLRLPMIRIALFRAAGTGFIPFQNTLVCDQSQALF